MTMIRPLLGAFEVSGRVGRILSWGAVLAVLVVGLGYGVRALRRWWLGEDKTCASPDWTLQDLRELKAKGELTEAEYETLRGAMIAGAQRDVAGRDRTAGSGGAADK